MEQFFPCTPETWMQLPASVVDRDLKSVTSKMAGYDAEAEGGGDRYCTEKRN